jgi:hypothetical protein
MNPFLCHLPLACAPSVLTLDDRALLCKELLVYMASKPGAGKQLALVVKVNIVLRRY